jgi:hypothetical protein
VLLFPVLDDESVSRKVAVYRQGARFAIQSRITDQCWESVLPAVVGFGQDLGYEIKNVLFVTVGSGWHVLVYSPTGVIHKSTVLTRSSRLSAMRVIPRWVLVGGSLMTGR